MAFEESRRVRLGHRSYRADTWNRTLPSRGSVLMETNRTFEHRIVHAAATFSDAMRRSPRGAVAREHASGEGVDARSMTRLAGQ